VQELRHLLLDVSLDNDMLGSVVDVNFARFQLQALDQRAAQHFDVAFELAYPRLLFRPAGLGFFIDGEIIGSAAMYEVRKGFWRDWRQRLAVVRTR
jgi:hypothetical protein